MKIFRLKTVWVLFFVLAMLVVGLTSCKKKETPTESEQQQQVADTEPNVEDQAQQVEHTRAELADAKQMKRRQEMARRAAAEGSSEKQQEDVLDEPELNPRADKLYQMSVFHSKVAKKPGLAGTSYKQMVEYCRQLFKEYPESVSVPKARLLLRQMPDRYKRQFNVTNEEMGL